MAKRLGLSTGYVAINSGTNLSISVPAQGLRFRRHDFEFRPFQKDKSAKPEAKSAGSKSPTQSFVARPAMPHFDDQRLEFVDAPQSRAFEPASDLGDKSLSFDERFPVYGNRFEHSVIPEAPSDSAFGYLSRGDQRTAAIQKATPKTIDELKQERLTRSSGEVVATAQSVDPVDETSELSAQLPDAESSQPAQIALDDGEHQPGEYASDLDDIDTSLDVGPQPFGSEGTAEARDAIPSRNENQSAGGPNVLGAMAGVVSPVAKAASSLRPIVRNFGRGTADLWQGAWASIANLTQKRPNAEVSDAASAPDESSGEVAQSRLMGDRLPKNRYKPAKKADMDLPANSLLELEVPAGTSMATFDAGALVQASAKSKPQSVARAPEAESVKRVDLGDVPQTSAAQSAEAALGAQPLNSASAGAVGAAPLTNPGVEITHRGSSASSDAASVGRLSKVRKPTVFGWMLRSTWLIVTLITVALFAWIFWFVFSIVSQDPTPGGTQGSEGLSTSGANEATLTPFAGPTTSGPSLQEILQAEQILADLGLLSGGVDGVESAATAQAVQMFQEMLFLPVTDGSLDQAILAEIYALAPN